MRVSAQPATKPARGPNASPTKAVTDPAVAIRRLKPTNDVAMMATAIAPMRKASGVAAPASGMTIWGKIEMAAVGPMIANANAVTWVKPSCRLKSIGNQIFGLRCASNRSTPGSALRRADERYQIDLRQTIIW